MNTRSLKKCKHIDDFIKPSPFPRDRLPTCMDVVQLFLLHRLNSEGSTTKDTDLYKTVAEEIMNIWKNVPTAVITLRTITGKIKWHVQKYQKFAKYPRDRKLSAKATQVFDLFLNDLKELFDISVCKCTPGRICATRCEAGDVVKKFLEDQRTKRQMNFDTFRRDLARVPRNIAEDTPENDTPLSYPSTSGQGNSSDFDTLQSTDQEVQNRYKLTNLVMAMDRCGISTRSAAILANAVLQDVGLITVDDTSMVIDKAKIDRERQAQRKKTEYSTTTDSQLRGLYFDGRKDKTNVQEKRGDKYYRMEIVEEHITVLEEPNQHYLGHFTPSSGAADKLAGGICNFLDEKQLDASTLAAVGCDGTPVNTGTRYGVIKRLEKQFNRPLHWFICQLHGNELILRHLFESLDGRKTGPVAFSGPISKSIMKCEELKVVDFEPIRSSLPDITADDLSKDQKYLLEISRAVAAGHCSQDLANRNPGPISHSRWVTTANRLLRLYIGSENPSDNLRTLVELIMRVYVPAWFTIKMNSWCFDGAKNLWKVISMSRSQPESVLEVIDPVIQRNAFFGHSENVLLGMIVDDLLDVRLKAMDIILECRESAGNGVRDFKIPTLNFKAADYTELIDWSNVTEPPLLKRIPSEILRELVIEGQTELIDMLKFPCHTQAVERHIKLVTRASHLVCGQNARESNIRNTLDSQKKMPKFETKRDYRL